MSDFIQKLLTLNLETPIRMIDWLLGYHTFKGQYLVSLQVDISTDSGGRQYIEVVIKMDRRWFSASWADASDAYAYRNLHFEDSRAVRNSTLLLLNKVVINVEVLAVMGDRVWMRLTRHMHVSNVGATSTPAHFRAQCHLPNLAAAG